MSTNEHDQRPAAVSQQDSRGTHQGDFLGIPSTGRDIEVDFIHIFRVADGRIVERWGVADTTLLHQLGATPKP